MGAKRMPMMRSVGRTVFGVRIGCQAFSRCCLNAVSMQSGQQGVARSGMEIRTGGSLPTRLSLF